jgi:peptidylprolyl isomerase
MRASHARAGLIAAALAATAAGAQQAGDALDPADWREVPADRLIVMDTTKGRILIETAPEFAPNHAARFSELVRSGFYDGITFHRVIDDFMVQGGDPTGTGTGGSGQNIDAEFTIKRDASMPVLEVSARANDRGGFFHGIPVVTQPIAQAAVRADGKVETWISHCAGVVSAARSEDPNSADSQFFLMRQSKRQDGSPNTYLDKQYTAWGHIVGGLGVVRDINVGTAGETRGFEPDSITVARIAADLPEGERPRVWVQREDGPAFTAKLAELTGQGPAPDVCDIEVPTVVADPNA